VNDAARFQRLAARLAILALPLALASDLALLAAVLPPLTDQYAQALPAQREVLQVVYSGFMNAVYLGLWNPLEVLLLAIWFLGMGPLIARERPMLGIVAQVFGFSGLLDVIGRIVNVDVIFYAGVSGFLLFPFWLPWLGIALLKSRVQVPAATQT
jgi:hypothetical protein